MLRKIAKVAMHITKKNVLMLRFGKVIFHIFLVGICIRDMPPLCVCIGHCGLAGFLFGFGSVPLRLLYRLRCRVRLSSWLRHWCSCGLVDGFRRVGWFYAATQLSLLLDGFVGARIMRVDVGF
jgi:hypothetical protein